MPLTEAQRAELEELSPDNVRPKLMQAGAGRGAVVPGFKSHDILRGDIEDWLAEKYSEEKRMEKRRTNVGNFVGIAGVVVAIVGIGVGIWLGLAK